MPIPSIRWPTPLVNITLQVLGGNDRLPCYTDDGLLLGGIL